MPSEIEDELGDAGAVTPSLFLGNTLPALTHFTLVRSAQALLAISIIKDGGTVLTPSPDLAMVVLLGLGISQAEAQEKITRANSVLDEPFDLAF